MCANEFEAGFFVRLNNTGGPVDVWAVTGITPELLIDAGSGFSYYPAPIPPNQIALIERQPGDTAPEPRRRPPAKRKR